jgi:hypothetical protein
MRTIFESLFSHFRPSYHALNVVDMSRIDSCSYLLIMPIAWLAAAKLSNGNGLISSLTGVVGVTLLLLELERGERTSNTTGVLFVTTDNKQKHSFHIHS